ncbi:MAG: hypothetical protein JNL10_15695 [Verrucomicrobiales bacterium]|nr:hypothetical protein [Verrucomicrobiales bacterium]
MRDRRLSPGAVGVAALLLILAGCSRPGSSILGQAPAGSPVSLDTARNAAVGSSVTVEAEMVEKCPEAGCWFILKDGTGTLRVDTKTAGFVVLDVPLHHRLSVSGQMVTNGSEKLLAATGVRY